MATIDDSRNVLLQGMPADVRRRVRRQFTDEPLAFKQTVFEQGGPVDRAYFVESGVLSQITEFADGDAIETGTIGNEGFAGLQALFGVARSSSRMICQIPGRAWSCPASVLADERDAGSAWLRLLLRYANFVTAMSAQSAACNRMHAVESRMSRWLLMTHDRVGVDDFPLTQEFLSQMLGVRRPTVNVAGLMLQRAGLIRYSRGRITVLDRGGLEAASCECYVRIREFLAESMHVPDGPPGRARSRSRSTSKGVRRPKRR